MFKEIHVKHLATAAALTAALVLGACASEKSAEAECKPAQDGAVHAVAVNGQCPVMPQDDASASTTLVDYKGQKVAFCCPGCVPKWNKMTEAQKDQALANVIAKK